MCSLSALNRIYSQSSLHSFFSSSSPPKKRRINRIKLLNSIRFLPQKNKRTRENTLTRFTVSKLQLADCQVKSGGGKKWETWPSDGFGTGQEKFSVSSQQLGVYHQSLSTSRGSSWFFGDKEIYRFNYRYGFILCPVFFLQCPSRLDLIRIANYKGGNDNAGQQSDETITGVVIRLDLWMTTIRRSFMTFIYFYMSTFSSSGIDLKYGPFPPTKSLFFFHIIYRWP